jgi:hypothetical protein
MRRFGVVIDFLFRRLRALWIGVIVPGSFVLAAVYTSHVFDKHLVQCLQVAGAGLDLLGLLWVARGYAELRIHFGRPPITESIRTFFRTFRKEFRGVSPQSVTGVGGSRIFVGLNARAKTGSGPNMPIEARLETLERGFSQLFDEVGSVRTEFPVEMTQVKALVADGQAKLEEQVAAERRRLETVTIGGLGDELIGWLWLVFGTFIAGAALIL